MKLAANLQPGLRYKALFGQAKPVESPREMNNLNDLHGISRGFADLSLRPLGYRACVQPVYRN